jgi:hypothetical protein
MTVQFKDSTRVHKFCQAFSDAVYDAFLSAEKQNMEMFAQLCAEPGISQMIEERLDARLPA